MSSFKKGKYRLVKIHIRIYPCSKCSIYFTFFRWVASFVQKAKEGNIQRWFKIKAK